MDLTEDEMKAIVYKYGPATIGYNTEDPNFFKVKSGPYNRKCRNNVADHAMLVIGWDKDNWIIKNSYSVGWGAEGYLYAPRAYAPGCALLKFAGVPFFDKEVPKSDSEPKTSENSNGWFAKIANWFG